MSEAEADIIAKLAEAVEALKPFAQLPVTGDGADWYCVRSTDIRRARLAQLMAEAAIRERLNE